MANGPVSQLLCRSLHTSGEKVYYIRMRSGTSNMAVINYQALSRQLNAATAQDIHYAVANAPFTNKLGMVLLSLGFICVYIADRKAGKVQLMAASGTEQYQQSVEWINFKPTDYLLTFKGDAGNTIVQAIQSGTLQGTADWATLCRDQTPIEVARLNQAHGGIAYTAVQPFTGPLEGALMFNYYQYIDQIGAEQHAFMERYTKMASERLAKLHG